YDDNESLQASIGGALSTSVVANDRDANRCWTSPAVIDVTTASNVLTLTISRNNSMADVDQRYLFRGLYITMDSRATVTWDDTVIDLVYPTAMDNSPATKGNMVPNSGFETGVDAGWGFDGTKVVTPGSTWDTTQAYEGQASVRLPLDL